MGCLARDCQWSIGLYFLSLRSFTLYDILSVRILKKAKLSTCELSMLPLISSRSVCLPYIVISLSALS